MAYYQPIVVYPNNGISVDSTKDIVFNIKVEGENYNYKIIVYQMNSTSADTQLYTSGDVILPTSLHNHQELQHTIAGGSLPSGKECYWTYSTWKTGEKVVTSRPYTFKTENTPVLTIDVPSTIASHEHEFVMTYTQAQGVSVNKYKFTLYNENEEELETSDWIESSDLKYKFTGFFSETFYKVKGFVINNNNVSIETQLKEFKVEYDSISVNSYPTLEIDSDTSIGKVEWSQITQSKFTKTGDVEYIQNYLKEGDVGLRIKSGATLQYDRDISADSTIKFVLQIDDNFNGKICELLDGTTLSYDNTMKKFILQHGGLKVESQIVDVSHYKQFIIIRQSIYTQLSLDVIEFEKVSTFTTWDYVNDNDTDWQEVKDGFNSWEDILRFHP